MEPPQGLSLGAAGFRSSFWVQGRRGGWLWFSAALVPFWTVRMQKGPPQIPFCPPDTAYLLFLLSFPALPAAPEPHPSYHQCPLAGATHYGCHVGAADCGERAGPGWGGAWQSPGPRPLPPAAGEEPQVQCSPPELLPLSWPVLSLQSGLPPEQWVLPCWPCPGPQEPLIWTLYVNKFFFGNGFCHFFAP